LRFLTGGVGDAGGGVGLLLLRGSCAGELALIKTAAQNINAWTALL